MPKINRNLLKLFKAISRIAAQNNIAAFLIGGFIRDSLLSRNTDDIDIAVSGDALSLAKTVAEAVSGKLIVLDSTNKIYRVIAAINDKKWHLDFSSFPNDILNDLARRDFTINSMAINIKEFDPEFSHIIDPYQGQEDLNRKIIKAVSASTFEDDPCRLIRAVRLAAVLNFHLDDKTEGLVKKYSQLIRTVPAERLREELLKILSTNTASHYFSYLNDLGLLTGIIPEISSLINFAQPGEHYWDVYNHSVQTVAAAELLLRQSDWRYNTENLLRATPWSKAIRQHFNENISGETNRKQLLKLGSLLHDIAKPATKTVDDNGRVRFIGHTKLGAEMATEILNRLRFSTKEVRIVHDMVYNHLRPAQMSNDDLPTSRAIYRFFRDTEGSGMDVLFLALADYMATAGPRLNIKEWNQHKRTIKYIIAEHSQQDHKVAETKLIDGNELMALFGLAPGRRIGKILSDIHEAQAAGELNTKQDAIMFVRKLLEKQRCDTAC